MEKRLIDANALLNCFREFGLGFESSFGGRFAIQSIKDATTIDAVEVVRCKDCVHRHSKLYCPMCDILADMSEDEGFCHCGEKEVEACS